MYLQRLASVCGALHIWDIGNSTIQGCEVIVFIQVKLDESSVTEDLCPNSDFVLSNVKLGGDVTDEGKHFVVVGLANAARGVKNEDNVGLSGAGWCSGVIQSRF